MGVDIEGKSYEIMGKNSFYNLPKIELAMFCGDNSREWLRKCNKYFLLNKIPEDQKLQVVEMFLSGRANNWFHRAKLEKPNMS